MTAYFRVFLPLLVLWAIVAQTSLAAEANRLSSPDGRLAVDFKIDSDGSPKYSVRLNDQTVLQESRLGLVRDDEDFSKDLKLVSQSGVDPVEDSYEILTAKRRQNHYQANRQLIHLETKNGNKLDIVFQVSNDGAAFRYYFPDQSTEVRKLTSEATTFKFPPDTKAWLQPMSVAKSGFEKSNPAYEEYYAKDVPVGTQSTLKAGWVYPALFRCGENWILLSEGSLGRNYCGTKLAHESPAGEYCVAFADPREKIGDGPVNPESKLPWLTPWRIIVVGKLQTIAESTLGIDLAEKPHEPADPAIKPGKSAWSWPLLGDKQTTYDTQKRFIDYAADMHWSYVLVDCWWDKQIGYDRMKELADYAATKNVGLLLWYNSAGDWNTVKFTPRDKMLTHESRLAEFDRLKAMGIKGLKIDFFGGDGQSVIAYYQDILDDAAPYGFLMNFHGATLPRGWQRTYPHLMTMEAIRGFEYVTFEQKNADEEPAHCTILPFTRNVFDPMDFTPVCLDRVNSRIHRKTTPAFELALSVLFTSGIQHYAEIPQGMANMPDYVQEFMKHVPAVWDDTKFIDGFPGKLVVLARQGDNRWYVAGINGEAVTKTLTVDLSRLPPLGESAVLITDGDESGSFQKQAVHLDHDRKLAVTLKPNGGFGMVFDQKQ
jgi:hypothetical protein